MNQLGPRPSGLLNVHDRVLGVVVDLYQLTPVLRDVAVAGHDQSYGLADEAHIAAGQRPDRC